MHKPHAPDMLGAVRALLRARGESPPLRPTPGNGPFPLSLAQERLWNLLEANPDDTAYNILWSFRLRGELNTTAFAASVNEMSRRHASLRTIFSESIRGAVQTLLPHDDQSLRIIDLREMNESERADTVRRLSEREAAFRFDCATGPLLRLRLLRLSDDEYILLLGTHHIIFDYWSFGLYFEELGNLYSRAVADETWKEPPESRPRYVDFAAWQRESLARGDLLERCLTYWSEKLRRDDSVPETMDTAGKRPRGSSKQRELLLDPSLTRSLREFAGRRGTTMYTLLLAAWQLVLRNEPGFQVGEDLFIYAPAANRDNRDTDSLIGYFVNLLVLRTSTAGNPEPLELLKRTHETVTGAYAHQDLPIQFLHGLESISIPEIRVMFTLLNTPHAPLRMREIEVDCLEQTFGAAEFDLFPNWQFVREGARCSLHYNSGLYDSAAIDELLKKYRTFLELYVTIDATENTSPDASPVQTANHSTVQEPEATAPDIRETAQSIRSMLMPSNTAEGPSAADQTARTIIASTLGLPPERIDPEHSLHAYGLNSLAAVHIRNRIQWDLGVEISLAKILRGISLREIENRITEAGKQARPVEGQNRTLAHEIDALSAGQNALWFLREHSPESRAYNIVQALRLVSVDTKDVVQDIFRAATRLVERHQALRTTYYFHNDAPRLRIHASAHFDRVQIDASGWSEDRLQDCMAEVRGRPFDLEHGPALRVAVISHGAKEHYVLLCLHHISMDFQSLAFLTRELRTLYGNLHSEGPTREIRIESPPENHESFVNFQRDLIKGPVGEKQWDYWREQLADLPLLNLPTDFPRPPIQMFRGASLAFEIPPALLLRIGAMARDAGVTRYMLLLTVFVLLLARYSDGRDIVLGGLASGRTRSDFTDTIGYFVNAVVLRTDLSGEPTFQELLLRVRDVVSGALENQDLPFPVVVERMAPERDLSRPPLFQVLFNMIQVPDDSPQSDHQKEDGNRNDRWSSHEVPQQEGQFDLTLELSETAGRTTAVFKYATDLFRESTIHRLRTHFLKLMEAALDSPEGPALRLPMMESSERKKILARGLPVRGLEKEYVPAFVRFEIIARALPNSPAIRFGESIRTYGELLNRAGAYAEKLRGLKVGPDITVAVATRRGPEMIAAMLGVHMSGGAYVPLDPAYPAERLFFMLKDSEARLLIAERDSAVLDAAAKDGTSQAIETLHPEDMGAWSNDIDHENTAPRNSESNTSAYAPEHLSHVIYTSGSTGIPKGVAIRQGGVAALMDWAVEQYSRDELSGVLAATSICFDLSVFEILVPLCAGGTVIIAANALELSELAAAEHVTLLNTVPSAATALVRNKGIPPSVRTVNLAGEPLSPDLVDSLYAYGSIQNVYDLYGPSEDTTYSTCARREMDGPAIIGRAIAGGGTYILDRELNPVPAGVPGELYLSGAGLARGYLNRPELTAEKFIYASFPEKTRLYRTGDLGVYTPEGDIRFLGRMDQQLKLRGYRIEPGEVQNVLEKHTQVQEAFVLRRGKDSYLTAYVTGPGDDLMSELQAYLREKLPEYMQPRFIIHVNRMPRTPNGKINSFALPAPLSTRDPSRVGRPGNKLEESIAEMWRDALNLEHVGPNENFFDLGGHSLLVLRIRARIKELHEIELSIAELFRENTVAALAGRIKAKLGGEQAPTSEAQSGSTEKRDGSHREEMRRKRRALRG